MIFTIFLLMTFSFGIIFYKKKVLYIVPIRSRIKNYEFPQQIIWFMGRRHALSRSLFPSTPCPLPRSPPTASARPGLHHQRTSTLASVSALAMAVGAAWAWPRPQREGVTALNGRSPWRRSWRAQLRSAVTQLLTLPPRQHDRSIYEVSQVHYRQVRDTYTRCGPEIRKPMSFLL